MGEDLSTGVYSSIRRTGLLFEHGDAMERHQVQRCLENEELSTKRFRLGCLTVGVAARTGR